MCKQGLFREDLYHRLNVFPIEMPALRERLEDLPLLIHYLAERTAKRLRVPMPAISKEGMDKLMRYSWPGNVRELENLVERAFILAHDGPLDIASLISDPEDQKNPESGICPNCIMLNREGNCISRDLLDKYIEEKVTAMLGQSAAPREEDISPAGIQAAMEKQIRRALEVCNGKVYGPGGAAELLGMNHNTLRSRMRKLGLKSALSSDADGTDPGEAPSEADAEKK